MAEGNVRGYLKGEEVRTKKYLYVLRPLLACRWIEQERGPAPMEFEKLYVTLDDEKVLRAIRSLVVRKKAGHELESGVRDPILSGFIDAELDRLTALPYTRGVGSPTDELDRLFRETVAAE
jgi:predicted nucleotidyltransferase